MKNSCSGVILAGGLSKRFSGRHKALISVGSKRIIDRIYDVFNDLFDEIILVTNDPQEYLDCGTMIVTDIFPFRSSLTGIQAGLFYSASDYTFFSACDTPFLKKGVIEMVLEGIDGRSDVVIPETAAGLEPLCAVYSKNCLKPAEDNLARQDFKIQNFFKRIRLKTIPETKLRKKDPDLVSFFNINSPGELAQAEKMVEADDEYK